MRGGVRRRVRRDEGEEEGVRRGVRREGDEEEG